MGRKGWTAASVLLLGVLCISVVSLVFPFVLFRDAYLRFPFSPWQAMGMLIVSALFVCVGRGWKGDKLVGFELMAYGAWILLLDVWLIFRIETAVPLALLGAVLIGLLLVAGVKLGRS
jgi:hypothetical protein